MHSRKELRDLYPMKVGCTYVSDWDLNEWVMKRYFFESAIDEDADDLGEI